jgi:general secretion pathway protein G
MKQHRNSSRYVRLDAGFTLVEIMVVVVILGLLGTMVVSNVIGMSDEARVQKAETDARTIWDTARQYKLRRRNWPTLEQLTTPDESGKIWIESYTPDPWDNDYEIREVDGNRILVISYGPDGSPDTEDDIYSHNQQDK